MAKWLELDRKLYGLQEDSSSSGGDEGDGGGGGDENWEMQRKKKKCAPTMKWESKGNRLPDQVHISYSSISYW